MSEERLLQQLERRMWATGNTLRAYAKNSTGDAQQRAWAIYEGLELGKSIVVKEMLERGIRPE